MVTVHAATSPSDAPPVTLPSTTENDLLSSAAVSSSSATWNDARVCPSANASAPPPATYSLPAAAVPSTVAHATATAPAAPPVRSTVSVTDPALSRTCTPSLSNASVPGPSGTTVMATVRFVVPSLSAAENTTFHVPVVCGVQMKYPVALPVPFSASHVSSVTGSPLADSVMASPS